MTTTKTAVVEQPLYSRLTCRWIPLAIVVAPLLAVCVVTTTSSVTGFSPSATITTTTITTTPTTVVGDHGLRQHASRTVFLSLQRHRRQYHHPQHVLYAQGDTETRFVTDVTNGVDSDSTADAAGDDADAKPPPTTPRVKRVAKGLASSIRRRFQRSRQRMETQLEEQDISEAAASSATLYMNPETAKLASNLVVSWETDAAHHIRALQRVSNPSRPLMVGVVGIPGSGKSTSCDILARSLSEPDPQSNRTLHPLVVPMDGYHYSMAQLLDFPNPDDAIYRRGACDTFDSAALARDLERIAHGQEPFVRIPGFDHAKGDPTPAQHTFERQTHNVVICEGLYLLHDRDGWEHVQKYLDWTIYIAADVDVCMDRLKERNKCIPGYTPEEIAIRCDAVDRVNALLAEETASKYASQVVESGAMS